MTIFTMDASLIRDRQKYFNRRIQKIQAEKEHKIRIKFGLVEDPPKNDLESIYKILNGLYVLSEKGTIIWRDRRILANADAAEKTIDSLKKVVDKAYDRVAAGYDMLSALETVESFPID